MPRPRRPIPPLGKGGGTGMDTIRRLMAALGTAAVVFAGMAAAAEAGTAGRTSGGVNPETGGILAEYNGRIIDLSQGWAGATVCMEEDDASVRCYDSVAEYRAAEG